MQKKVFSYFNKMQKIIERQGEKKISNVKVFSNTKL